MSIQADVREAITRADVLSRIAHEQREEELAEVLDGLRSELDWIDEAIGGHRPAPCLLRDLDHMLDRAAGISWKLGEDMAEVLDDTVRWMRALHGDLKTALSARSMKRRRRLVVVAACVALGVALIAWTLAPRD